MIKDRLIGLTLFIIGLAAYTSTLAPTLLDGDAALFQYIPYVLGITYPTGFPMYLLVAKLWLSLFPIGEIAWRMNLFSAVCGSLALPVFYGAARRIWANRLAALMCVFIFATLPTYWRWATEAKVYTFNILLFSIVLWLAVKGDAKETQSTTEPKKRQRDTISEKVDSWISKHRYKLGALILGIQVGGHNTTVLLIPGLILLFWLDYRKWQTHNPNLRFLITHSLIFIVPLTSYLYIPLRAEWLLTQYSRQQAIAQGLMADFYNSGLAGLVRYFTAADFTGGVVSNWGQVPTAFFTIYVPLLQQDFTWLGIALGVIGAILLALRAPRFFWPFLLLYLAPIPFVLTYNRGEQSAFLLTSDLAFALFSGGLVALVDDISHQIERITPQIKTIFGLVVFSFIFMLLPYPQSQYNHNWLKTKWDTSHYDYWADVLSHPIEAQAGIMATWGDLTSMWYMQHVEDRRPDLAGLYPPTEDIAAAWLAKENNLYIAGPVMDTWQMDIMNRYHVLPWGRLVRLAPLNTPPADLLPTLAQAQDATFAQKLHLSGADFAPSVNSGGTLYVYLAWQVLRDLPAQTRYSLRLVQADGVIAQKDDTLLSGWFPLDYLPANRPLIGAYPLDIPLGTLPGNYHLQLAVYEAVGNEWPLDDNNPVLDLGPVAVTFAPASTAAGAMRFNGELTLDEFEFSVKRVGQGKGFQTRLLWRALTRPEDNYTLLIELIDQEGHLWRSWQHPVETASWQAAQQVQQRVDITIPAEAPPGEDSLNLHLSWLRPDGSHLPLRRWILPAGEHLTLNAPRITLKPNRTFEKPRFNVPLNANFENKAALIGYDMPLTLTLTAENPNVFPLTLYWQGRGEMETSYYVFVHLLDENGNLVAQQDAVPGVRNKQPTTSWAIGEYITDPVEISLPPTFTPGTYSVAVGIYAPPTGPRLLHLDENGKAIGDFVYLGEVHIGKFE